MADYSFDTLKHQAESLGLVGDDVAKYVVTPQSYHREERAKERDLEKVKIEAEKEIEKARLETEGTEENGIRVRISSSQ